MEIFNDLFIFEMANNHQGSVEHGRKIIQYLGDLKHQYGINAAVKFQYRDLDTMIHPDFISRRDVKHIPRFLDTRLMPDEFYELVVAAREAGLRTMCTPFDEKSVDLCMDHGIEIIKVASCSAMDWPLLEKIAETHRPVIISTGGKSYSDMDKIYNFFTHRKIDFAMLHCVGIYPVKEEQVQLDCIDKMKKRYPKVPIGYSGHEDPQNYSIAQMAVAKGAVILERHVGLKTEEITLNAYSTDVRELNGWIDAVLSARKMCGKENEKNIPIEEIQSMRELARGCYAKVAIKRGEELTREKLFFAMPCMEHQMTSGEFEPGMIASQDYEINNAIYEHRKVTVATDTRSLIHDVKGMLYEANIAIGDKFELELSHHYGIEHFRHYGATIINILNREYCKKILVVLPGQQHPVHYHKIKEESFQVLAGTLKLTLDEKEILVDAGEVITIERGKKHAFTSDRGCIFEEISTTHVKNDSYYDDNRINEMSLSDRKTIFENW